MAKSSERWVNEGLVAGFTGFILVENWGIASGAMETAMIESEPRKTEKRTLRMRCSRRIERADVCAQKRRQDAGGTKTERRQRLASGSEATMPVASFTVMI